MTSNFVKAAWCLFLLKVKTKPWQPGNPFMINSGVNTYLLWTECWKAIKKATKTSSHLQQALKKTQTPQQVSICVHYLVNVNPCEDYYSTKYWVVAQSWSTPLHITKQHPEWNYLTVGKKSLAQAATPHSNAKGPKKSLLLTRTTLRCHCRQPLMKGWEEKIIPQEKKATILCKKIFSEFTTPVSVVPTVLEIRISA